MNDAVTLVILHLPRIAAAESIHSTKLLSSSAHKHSDGIKEERVFAQLAHESDTEEVDVPTIGLLVTTVKVGFPSVEAFTTSSAS